MFTVEQIENAHGKVQSGSDFPSYIREIKELGVQSFETRVKDCCTEYFGAWFQGKIRSQIPGPAHPEYN
ncbi:DUF1398 family protein [Chryseobacterium camelliae]|uniref:DUF1398 family protein n=1 Tax=Chryseobacterium camelliae TaxID=1265445 RepID=UPI002864B2E7|nr:DUF1398 family protein [Chryseobacterium camelliae]MDR6515001.1 hypothetical protein [Chryseobacterium camelliae]